MKQYKQILEIVGEVESLLAYRSNIVVLELGAFDDPGEAIALKRAHFLSKMLVEHVGYLVSVDYNHDFTIVITDNPPEPSEG